MPKPFAFNYAVRSDIGLVRDTNQDSAYASENLLVVADGMGGHAGGDVASTIAINVIESLDHAHHTAQTAVADLEIALEQARLALVRASELVPRLQGLGTTVVCLLNAGPTLYMAHMGDSRAYLLRDGELMQITIDHTFVQHLIDLGRITPAEAEHHPQRNVVMRVLSDFDLNLSPEISVREARVGDRWLLCSDGLSGFVSPEEILSIVTNYAAPDKAADALVAAALANQSNDNVTCLVADIVAPESVKAQQARKVGAVATNGPYPQLVATVVAEAARRVGRTDQIDDWVTEEIWLGTQPIDTNAVVAAVTAPDPSEADTELLPKLPAAESAAVLPRPEPLTPPVVTQVVARMPGAGAIGVASPAPGVGAVPLSSEDPLGELVAATRAPAAIKSPTIGSLPMADSLPPLPGAVASMTSGAISLDSMPSAPAPVVAAPVALGLGTPVPVAISDPDLQDDDPAALPAAKGRPWLAVGITLAILGLVSVGLWRAYAWTQTQYFVGISNGQVAVFRGIPDTLGPVRLNHPVQLFDAPVSEMPELFLGRLDGTIRSDSFAEAVQRAQGLIAEALPTPFPNQPLPNQPAPAPTDAGQAVPGQGAPTPTTTPTGGATTTPVAPTPPTQPGGN